MIMTFTTMSIPRDSNQLEPPKEWSKIYYKLELGQPSVFLYSYTLLVQLGKQTDFQETKSFILNCQRFDLSKSIYLIKNDRSYGRTKSKSN